MTQNSLARCCFQIWELCIKEKPCKTITLEETKIEQNVHWALSHVHRRHLFF